MINTTIGKSWDRHMSISIYVGNCIGIAIHCVKRDRMRSCSGPFFPNSDQNNFEYVSLRIQSECRKMRIRITPTMDTFYAVIRRGITKIYCRTVSKIFKRSVLHNPC